jgi:hypothetical protein
VIGGKIKKNEVVIFECSKKILDTADFVTSVLNCVIECKELNANISKHISRSEQDLTRCLHMVISNWVQFRFIFKKLCNMQLEQKFRK